MVGLNSTLRAATSRPDGTVTKKIDADTDTRLKEAANFADANQGFSAAMADYSIALMENNAAYQVFGKLLSQIKQNMQTILQAA